MSKRKQLVEIEKALEQKQKDVRENEVILGNEDFKDGKLTVSAYRRLKEQYEYIEYDDDTEIIVPQNQAAGFKDSLETMAANELMRIKKDRLKTRTIAAVCIFLGIILFSIRQIFIETNLMNEITLVATWVFVWTAVEKWFFGNGELIKKRLILLQILASKITER